MKYKIQKAQLGSVLNPRTISGTKSKSGNIQWENNFDITTPGKQAVMLPGVTVTPSISIGNLQREVDEWNKKYPQSTSEVPIVAKLTGDKQLFTRTPKVIGMSGADPVGQFIVEGAILGKPTQYILDKGLTAAVGKTSGELLGQAWGGIKKGVNSSINFAQTTRNNYIDINNLNKFAFKYQYKVPRLNIFQPDKINNAYKTVLDQHNTFVRGISLGEPVLSKPQVLDQLIKANVYNPKVDKVLPREKIAEYMATRIPGDTGYGRAGLEEGLENGLYTSNSIDFAKGYTYGDGYVATVRRPVDYSSSSRKDWLKSGDFKLVNDIEPGKNKLLRELNININNSVKRYTDLDKAIKNRYTDKYSSDEAILKMIEDIGSNNVDAVTKQGLEEKLRNIGANRDELESLLKSKFDRKQFGFNIDYKTKINDLVKNNLKDSQSNIKFGMSETPLTKKIFSRGLSGKRLVSVKGNPYQHFIFTGNPGEKVVDLINLEPIKGGVNDYTRMHIGKWSEGLSRKSYKKGGRLKLNKQEKPSTY